MAINLGPTLKRRREWARLTQQELVDHTRLDRSASYISALRGRTPGDGDGIATLVNATLSSSFNLSRLSACMGSCLSSCLDAANVSNN